MSCNSVEAVVDDTGSCMECAAAAVVTEVATLDGLIALVPYGATGV